MEYLGNGDPGFHEMKQEEFDGNIKDTPSGPK